MLFRSSAAMYQPEINQWSHIQNLPVHKHSAACVTIDDCIIIIGGHDNIILFYDTKQDKCQQRTTRGTLDKSLVEI